MSVERSLQTLFNDSDDLRGEYTGIEEVYRALAVVTPDGEKFHRPAGDCDESHPKCTPRDEEWQLVETDEARRAGFSPCRRCFAPVSVDGSLLLYFVQFPFSRG